VELGTQTVLGIDYSMWKTILLVVFFVVFVAIVLRLLLSRPGRYERAARLPLEDDPPRRETLDGTQPRNHDHGR
jgi:cbb3-type cytochrome oxidase subunit 3